jgi:hypothetical protein
MVDKKAKICFFLFLKKIFFFVCSVNSLFRRRFNNLSSVITNRLWLNAHSNYECDVLLTFSARIDDYVIVWFLEQLLQLAPDIQISIKYHFTTGKQIFEK